MTKGRYSTGGTRLSKTNFPSKKAANIIHQLTNHRADANAYKTIKKGFTALTHLPSASHKLCHRIYVTRCYMSHTGRFETV